MARETLSRTASVAASACALLAALPAVAQQGNRPASAPAPDVPRAGFIATMDAQFRAQDSNNDGQLTRAEIEASERAKVLVTAQSTNRQIFAQLDTDHNGALSPAEFAGLIQQPPVPDVSGSMARLDANRDQVVTLIEYRATTLANFDRLDTDHDGIVTAAEMRAGGIAPTGR